MENPALLALYSFRVNGRPLGLLSLLRRRGGLRAAAFVALAGPLSSRLFRLGSPSFGGSAAAALRVFPAVLGFFGEVVPSRSLGLSSALVHSEDHFASLKPRWWFSRGAFILPWSAETAPHF